MFYGVCCCCTVLLTVGGQQNVQGAISVLVKYTAMVQEHVHQVLPVAAAVAAHSGWHFCLAAHALSGTVRCLDLYMWIQYIVLLCV